MAQVEIKIPVEYKALYEDSWRYVVYYGGRYCFSGETLVTTDSGYNRIDSLKVGDKVLSRVGVYDTITSIDKFEASYDPKPMIAINVNGVITNATYDHKYWNGQAYVPLYKLIWGVMDASQRRELELLCEQYGETTHNELQGWLSNKSNEASSKSEWVFSNSSKWQGEDGTQNSGKDVYTEPRKQRNSEPHKRHKDRQSSSELGVGNKTRADDTCSKDESLQRPLQDSRRELSQDNRKASERNTTVQIRTLYNADKNDVSLSGENHWDEICWDTRFIEWSNMETSASGVSSQEDDNWRGEKISISVERVYESVDTYAISVTGGHNYFANGINVSNSLKSYNVALSQLIRGRQKKMRFLDTREIQNSIKDSVHKLLADQIERYGFTDYEVMNDTIRNRVTGTEFIFRGLRHNINEIKSMEGIDEAWIEEGHSVTKQSLDILLPTIRKAGSRIVVTFNRLTELDPVYVKFVQEPQEKCYTKHLNYDIAEKYNLMTDAIRQEVEHDKKTDPALYAHKWLGQPLSQTDKAIISRDSVVEAFNRTVSDEGAIEVGVDVARFGGDRTELVKRKGLKEIDRRTFTKLSTVEVVEQVERFVDNDKTIPIKVDDTGVGGGVTDQHSSKGYNVIPVNFGGKAGDPDKYPNIISEAWFYMQGIMKDISLVQDNELLMELTTREWVMDSKGRRGVESKDSYKKKGYRSPDKADATILCFFTPKVKVTQWATSDDLF